MTAPAATPLRVRQSFAARFDQCPLSAKWDRDAHDVDTHPQARGTIFHEFARRLIQECIDSGERKAPPGYARDLMAIVIAESGLPITAREHDELLKMAGDFAQTREFAIDRIVDLEETYTVELGGATLTGRPDRVDILGREAWVWDYKTGWATDPEAEMRGTFQGRLYARMVFDAYPQVETVHLVWDYPRWGANGIRQTSLTRLQVPDIDGYLEALIGRIRHSVETDTWAASPGPWCVTCPLPGDCPVPAGERREGVIQDDAQALELAHDVTVLSARVNAARKALRPWCDEHGPIVVDGVEFGFKLKADSQQCRDKDDLRMAMEHADELLDGFAGAVDALARGETMDSDRLAELLTAASARVPLTWDVHFKPVKGSAEFKARKAA